MKDTFDNFLRMVAAMITFLTGSTEMLTKYPVLAGILPRLTAQKKKVDDEVESRGGRNTGYAGTKGSLRGNVVDTTYKVMKALHQIAVNKKLPDIIAATEIRSKSPLKRMRDNELVGKAKEIYKLALPHAADFAGFLINIEDIITAAAAFEASIGEMGSAKGKKKGGTENIGDEMQLLEDLVEDELDSAMEAISDNESAFYNKFKGVREVLQYGIRHDKNDEPPQDPDQPPQNPDQPAK